jgi:hypothetical protein
MSFSNIEAAKFALLPGIAESSERALSRQGNMGWKGIVTEAIVKRNAMYIFGILSAAAIVGGILTSDRTVQFICAGSASLCVLGCIAAAKGLYDTTKLIQQTVNSKDRT